MDYKNIEQLLKRYWQCETSVEEEGQLREFFSSEEVPTHLLPYKSLFVYQKQQHEIKLSDDFDTRILEKIEPVVFKAKHITFISRFNPLFRAAVVVALFLMLGNVAQKTIFQDDRLDYNYNTYRDTYNDPDVAYKKVSSALNILSNEINKSQNLDSDSIIKTAVRDSIISE